MANAATGQATFLISLDCEGPWGLYQFGKPWKDITNAALIGTYRRLIEQFQKSEIKATFAFVTAYTMDPAERRYHSELFAPMIWRGVDWFLPIRRAIEEGGTDPWFCPELQQLVMETKVHEIACHGFSHIPFHPNFTSAETARREFEAIRQVEARRGYTTETFVFPCNVEGHTDLLARYQFKSYRPPRKAEAKTGLTGRALRLASEFNPFEKLEGRWFPQSPVQLPSGRFLNPRFGLRYLVPAGITILKVKKLIDQAIQEQECCHIYAHCHDFLRAPTLYDVLDCILGYLTDRSRRKEIQSLTQSQQTDLDRKRQAVYAQSFATASKNRNSIDVA